MTAPAGKARTIAGANTAAARRHAPTQSLARALPQSLSLHQTRQVAQLVPAGIRDRAVLQVAVAPEDHVVAVAHGLPGERRVPDLPAEYVDDMCTMPVHEHRRALSLQGVHPTSGQSKAVRGKIRDDRGDVGVPGKPRLHRVMVARLDGD